MTDRRKNLHRQLLVDLPAQRPGISTVSIPAASLVEQMGLHRAPVPFFDQLTDFVAGLPGRHPALLAFFSMTDRRKNLHRQLLVDLPAQRPGISTVSIPAASLVEQMGLHRAPVPFFAPRSPITRAYERLWQQVDAQVPGVLPGWAGAEQRRPGQDRAAAGSV